MFKIIFICCLLVDLQKVENTSTLPRPVLVGCSSVIGNSSYSTEKKFVWRNLLSSRSFHEFSRVLRGFYPSFIPQILMINLNLWNYSSFWHLVHLLVQRKIFKIDPWIIFIRGLKHIAETEAWCSLKVDVLIFTSNLFNL